MCQHLMAMGISSDYIRWIRWEGRCVKIKTASSEMKRIKHHPNYHSTTHANPCKFEVVAYLVCNTLPTSGIFRIVLLISHVNPKYYKTQIQQCWCLWHVIYPAWNVLTTVDQAYISRRPSLKKIDLWNKSTRSRC